MKTVALKAEKRTETGKNINRRLRQSGMIPAILYGGKEVSPLAINALDFEHAFKHISENVLINLEIKGGEKREVLIKGYQREKVKGALIHIDFLEIIKGKKLHTRIPVRLDGMPIGVKIAGGMLEHLCHDLQVECLPKDMPEEIRIDVSGLDVGDAVHAKDLGLPEGVHSLESPETVVAMVTGKQAELLEEEEEVTEEAGEEGTAEAEESES